MTKLSDLPKATISSKKDLITIIQGGAVKNISKANLLGYLEGQIKNISTEVDSLQRKVSSEMVQRDNPVFKRPVLGEKPTASNHLTTKRYVDDSLHNVVRNDGTSKLVKTLTLSSQPKEFKDSELVSKMHVDSLLKGTLKTIIKYSDNVVPAALVGDCFIMEKEFEVFAVNGPEIQKGDILVCLEDSSGGVYKEVGHQFAIINTNVVSATEADKGIIKIATAEEMSLLGSNSSAITPKKFRVAAEGSSVFNRVSLDRDGYTLLEKDKGIVAVDSRRESILVSLPPIGSLKIPKLVKYTIKDEFGQADLYNITISGGSSATIDGKNSIVLSQKYQAITIYNDGKNYYIENNTHSADVDTENLIKAGKKYPVVTNVDDPVYAFDVDLSQFDVNQGMEIEASGAFAANTNVKTVKLKLGGTVLVSNTISAPNGKSFNIRATIYKSGTGTSYYNGTIHIDGSTVAVKTSGVVLDWVTVESVAAVANCPTAITDITFQSFTIKLLK